MALFLIWRDGHAWPPWLVVIGNAALGTWAVVGGREAAIARLTVFEADPRLLTAASLGCFAAVGVASLTPLRRWDWRGLTAVGALTYPLYLVHEPFGRWTIELAQPHLPRFVVLGAA
ncbi:MAG TPA: hypothetical protein PKB06_05545, partial [Actinotalea sp.]|nr:hypothetical protein [Actinotalea sp.]